MQVLLFKKKNANTFWQATRDWYTNTGKQKDMNRKYLLFMHKNMFIWCRPIKLEHYN